MKEVINEKLLLEIWLEVLELPFEGSQIIDVHDNFFELGGDSLSAMQIVSRIKDLFSVDLPADCLFEAPTVSELVQLLNNHQPMSSPASILPTVPEKKESKLIFPLSLTQERLWTLNQIEGNHSTDNICRNFWMEGAVDQDILQYCIRELVKRHESLRSIFPSVDGTPRLKISEPSIELKRVDLSHLPQAEQKAEVDRLIRTEVDHVFDLGKGPLFRCRLLELGENAYVLLLTLPHMIVDDWSIKVFIKDLNQLYANYPIPLPPLSLQFSDYADRQRRWLQGNELAQQIAFWEEHLRGAPDFLKLPTDFPRPPLLNPQGKLIHFTLSETLTSGVKALSTKTKGTLFITLFSAFTVLLARYSGENDIVIGSPIADRPNRQYEDLVGLFLNILILRLDLTGNPSFSEVLERARKVALGAYGHQNVPFEELLKILKPKRSASYTPLFQVMFVLSNTPSVSLNLLGVKSTSLPNLERRSKYDLTLYMSEDSKEMRGSFRFNTQLFESSTIERMVRHFKTLLHAFVNYPSHSIYQQSLLTVREQNQLFLQATGPVTEYPRNACLPFFIEHQVAKTPFAVAMVFENQILTYQQLDHYANEVGQHLQQLGIGKGDFVPILMEPSLEVPIAFLAVMKIGAAFVPLDTRWPFKRIEKILNLVNSKKILINRKGNEISSFEDLFYLLNVQDLVGMPNALPVPVQANDPIYAIFTSGSTGEPKGAVNKHRGIVNRFFFMNRRYGRKTDEIVLQTTPHTFDSTVWQMFWPLINGGRCVLSNRDFDPQIMIEMIEDHQITFSDLVPSTMAVIVEMLRDNNRLHTKFRSVRQLIVGGEAIQPPVIYEFKRYCSHVGISNGYGPTETAIGVLFHEVVSQEHKKIPIGRPIDNTSALILDRYLNCQPLGVPGELYLAGDCLGLGYLKNPEATERAFIPNPFPEIKSEKLYKTGDLARLKLDNDEKEGLGNIEYLGRLDDQVKIRGFRIELGEIEACLRDHPRISECALIVYEGQGPQTLIAFGVERNKTDEELSQSVPLHESVMLFLKERLPGYMVPTVFVRLEELPLTSVGKTDRLALQKIACQVPQEPQKGIVLPRTPEEKQLVEIWKEVLGIPSISIHDNFFDLGGHSLSATQVVLRCGNYLSEKGQSKNIPLKVLFENPTIDKFAQNLTQAQKIEALLPLTREERKEVPLSTAQQRLWFLDQLEVDNQNQAYHIALSFRLEGNLNTEVLFQSLKEIMRRHDSLRMCFPSKQGVPWLEVAEVNLPMSYVELSSTSGEEAIQAVIDEVVSSPFDLSKGPLFRTQLIKSKDSVHILTMVMHHIISDAWSLEILKSELSVCYKAFISGKPLSLPLIDIRYQDFARWQQICLNEGAWAKQSTYWQQQLSSVPHSLGLPTDHPRPAMQTYQGATVPIELDRAQIHSLNQLGRETNTTLFMILLSAFALVLSRYSGEKDLVIGTPISNRNHPQLENLIGFFINTLALRINLSASSKGELNVIDLLKRVRKMALEAYANQDLPFEQLVEAVHVERNLGQTPLFQVMFMLGNVPIQAMEMPGVTISIHPQKRTVSKFDLSLILFEKEEGHVKGRIEYATRLFEKGTVERIAGHFTNILEEMVDTPLSPLHCIAMLNKAERHKILKQWNATEESFPTEKCLHQLFEEQAVHVPDHVAVIFEEVSVSYESLNKRANELAHFLKARGVCPESLVGICMDRSIDLVVGLLGILKAGGAYIPIDPSYPKKRMQFLLEDANVSVLLTQRSLADTFNGRPQTICLDEIDFQNEDCPNTNLQLEMNIENLAYVIYTSGSTGKPKGVMNSHAGIYNRLQWMQKYYVLEKNDRVLQKTPYSFDVSVWEFFWPLINGAQLVLARPGGHQDPEYLANLIEAQKISVLHFVPSMLRVFLENQTLMQSCVRHVFCSGEALPANVQNQFFQKSKALLHNLYGPTEAAIDVTAWKCRERWEKMLVPIGFPISNIQVYILDGHFNPVPLGVTGELYLGGVGVARGYLNRPELTAEKFVPDPFGQKKGARLYKTGDLGRYVFHEFGSEKNRAMIEFLGRTDHQVKIRGLRIELGEIETNLSQYHEIQEAIVVVRKIANHPTLVAYILSNVSNSNALVESEIRTFLKARLPEYMVPAHYVVIDQFPMTSNGKIDRNALPDPVSLSKPENDFPPKTLIEQQLATIWQTLLGKSAIGIYENFFESGGDSILSMQVVSRGLEMGLPLIVKDLFQYQTIAELADIVSQKTKSANQAQPVEQASVIGAIPLIPIHHWFFEQNFTHPHHYNQTQMIQVVPELTPSQLESILQALWKHHDILRLHVVDSSEEEITNVTPIPNFLTVIDLIGMSPVEKQAKIQTVAVELQESFQLTTTPFFKAILFQGYETNTNCLFLVAHHLVVDGVSWKVLLGDFSLAYRQLIKSQPIEFPAKTTSSKVWGELLQNYSQSAELQAEREYWSSFVSSPKIKRDFQNALSMNTGASRSTISVTLSLERTHALLTEVPKVYRTEINDVLLTALLVSYCQWSNQSSLYIDLEGHGREALFDGVDLSRTVGWFTSLFPMLLKLPDGSMVDCLKSVKEQIRSIPKRGIGFGLLKYLDRHGNHNLDKLASPEICFNYLGQIVNETREPPFLGEVSLPVGAAQSDDNQRPHLINIQSSIRNGQLSVDWIFSRAFHLPETIASQANQFLVKLNELIALCCLPDAWGFTPSDFPLVGLSPTLLDKLVFRDIEDLYPMTPLQQGMLFHSLLEPESHVYFEQLCIELQGELNTEIFQKAWQQVMERHAVLRSQCIWKVEQTVLPVPLIQIHKTLSLMWKQEDWCASTEAERTQKLSTYLEEDRNQSFFKMASTEASGPLMRFSLIRKQQQKYQFIWSYHHLLIDGWCVPLLLKDVFSHYHALIHEVPLNLPRPRPFQGYVAWLKQQDLSKAENFWKNTLRGFTGCPALGVEKTSSRGSTQFKEKRFRLSVEETKTLKAFAQKRHITLNILVQGAWAILLSRYSGEQKVIFGETVAGRPPDLRGSEQMIGLFINSLPVYVSVDDDQFVGDWLQELQQQRLAREPFSYSPLVEIHSWCGQDSNKPLFDSLIAFENYPMDQGIVSESRLGDLRVTKTQFLERTHYPLTLAVVPHDDLLFKFSYDSSQFEDKTIDRLFRHLWSLLRQMSNPPRSVEPKLKDVGLLTPTEKHQLTIEWNQTYTEFPHQKCVHRLFEEQVQRTPNNKAVIVGQQSLSFQELNQKSNQLAHYLKTLGVQSNVLVGVCTERSLEMVIGLLAILKAGGAYVPIDPRYPKKRKEQMLEQSQISILLSQTHLMADLVGNLVKTICLDSDNDQWQSFSTDNLERQEEASQWMYMIYTSGSTGVPKGAGVFHRGFVNLLHWYWTTYELGASDRVLVFNSFSFDLTQKNIFTPLLRGGQLHLMVDGVFDPQQIVEKIGKDAITWVNCTPSAIYPLLEVAERTVIPYSQLSSLRFVCLGGEPIAMARLQPWLKFNPKGVVANTYGPTECTDVCVAYTVKSPGTWLNHSPPIGRPIANTKLYILDASLQPVPIGVKGELYIGGIGVGAGYYDDLELTKEKFIRLPFYKSTSTSEAFDTSPYLYRTGDIVRFLDLPDEPLGTIEFLGRKDDQTKIRGVRIELGEIETLLQQHPSIKEGVVLFDQEALIAVFVLNSEVSLTEEVSQSLRSFLKERLPEVMVPSHYCPWDALPLTPSGKVDRRTLQQQVQTVKVALKESDKVLPQTPEEQQMAELWAEVLNVEPIGIHDDFFEIGGHSLTATRLVLRIRDSFEVEIPLKQLFDFPTIATLTNSFMTLVSDDSIDDSTEWEEIEI